MAILPMTPKREITKQGDLSDKEMYQSIRDALIISVAGIVPQIVNIALQSQYADIISIILMIAIPIINRTFNFIRITPSKDKKTISVNIFKN